MNRQNILQEEIISFSFDGAGRMLKDNPIEFFQIIEKLATRKLSVSDTGIDRKLLYTWKRKDLLPFEQEEGWGRFSFIELCWLNLLAELRAVGTGIEKIQKIKTFFFRPGFIDELFSIEIEDFEILHPDHAKAVKENIRFQDKKAVLSDEQKNVLLKDLQFSLFTIAIYSIIMTRMNLCVYMDSTEKIEAFDLNILLHDSTGELQNLFDLMSNNTLVIVNLKKIVADISGTHEYFSKILQFDTWISNNSVQILKKLFADKTVKEVIVRKIENGRALVHVKKEMELKELQREIHSLFRKGTFKDIIVKTRDGNVQYFEKTDIIKL